MIASISHKDKTFKIDLSKPIDISIPLRPGKENVNAWYADPVRFEPVRMGDWVGDVNQGGSVNFRNVFFNPHGNGTHTECVGHISKENYTINQCLKQFFFIATVISVKPERKGDDEIITLNHLKGLKKDTSEALVIRTLPNLQGKINKQYSDTNPAYILQEAMDFIQSIGIKHLLIDLPSVDRERDEGKLLAHHSFWQYPGDVKLDRTITEMIYVPDSVTDGEYLLNIQIASFENDASPSKPLLYKIMG